MSFFNDLGKKISGAAEVAADKAKELAEITKLNYEISSTQKQIDNDYNEIGRQIFQMEKDNPASPVAELCQKITAAQESIAALNAKIQQIKSDGQTSTVPAAASTAPSDAPAKRFCSNCGTEVSPEGKFCPGCGTPIN